MRCCNVGNTEISISLVTVPILCAYLILYPWHVVFCAILALGLHETAHILTARKTGFRIDILRVTPFGAWMQLDTADGEGRNTAWIAIAGPAANCVAAGAVALLLHFHTSAPAFLSSFLTANLVLGFGNLLPVFPLDGGRVLQSVLERVHTQRFVRNIMMLTSFCMEVIGMFFGAWELLQRREAGMLLFAVSMSACSITAFIRRDSAGANTILQHRQVLLQGKALPVHAIVLRQTALLSKAVSEMHSGAYHMICVLDDRNRPVGMIDEEDLLSALGSYGSRASLSEIMRNSKLGVEFSDNRGILNP